MGAGAGRRRAPSHYTTTDGLMAISAAYKALIADGVWASSPTADRAPPSDFGLQDIVGWPLPYEQRGAGKEPEREVFNELHHRVGSGLIDMARFGVPQWDAEVDYRPTADAHCFVTTRTGLWVTDQPTGPAFGNATDPDQVGQDIWRQF